MKIQLLIICREGGVPQWYPRRTYRILCSTRKIQYDTLHRNRLARYQELTKIEYPRDSGTAPTDVTAFHKDQEDWGPERDQRPDILHQYEKRGHQNPTYLVPLLIHKEAIVLDYNNRPILDFENMPMTVSSKLEGWLQEAMIRKDARIDVADFRVRSEFSIW